MKALTIALCLAIYAMPLSAIEDFSDKEREAVAKEVSAMMESFNEGDVKALIAKTHPSIYKLAKGKENFDATLLAAAEQIVELGVTIESSEIGLPTKLHKAGKDLVCFVPKTTLMSIKGQLVKSVSYMVAIKGKDGVWRYLDGAGARRNPDQLWTLLPDLPKDVEVPENSIAPVEKQEVEQDGADQPATRHQSAPSSNSKPQPDSEARPQ
jgi:hypothetical protein